MSAEVDSDEERELKETTNPSDESSANKHVYTKATRELAASSGKGNKSKRIKKDGEEDEAIDADEVEYEDDEEYYKKFAPKETNELVEEDNLEDMLKMQLQYEKEEAERKATAAAAAEGKSVPSTDSTTTQVKTKVDPDGTEYEWDPVVKGWFPKLSVNKLIEYQQAYKAPTTTPGGDQSATYANLKEDKFYLCNGGFFKWNASEQKWVNAEQPVYEYIEYMSGVEYEWNQAENQWKAKSTPQQQAANSETATQPTTAAGGKKQAAAVKKEGWFQIDDDKNTNVYVSGLPLDITDDEFEKMMSKYGIIMKDPLTHKLKCKLYKDNDEVKGDGRCCYLQPESVKLCLQLLDGSDFRGKTIKVEKAKFEMKGNYDPKKASTSEAQKKKLSKIKEKKIMEKQRQKLLDWEERPEVVRQKHEKVVVIKNLFVPEDIQNDRSVINRIRDEVRSELEQYGDVKKILIHERNPEGVVTVSFKEVDDADRCVEHLDNRVWKNGRIIRCATWDGQTKFEVEETEEEQQRRIEEWHRFIEGDE